MKNLCLVFLIFISSSLFALPPVEKEIGDEIVVFKVPDDYETLVTYYKAIIEVYAASENRNLLLEEHIKILSKDIDEVVDISDQMKEDVSSIEDAVKIYEKTRNMFFTYWGAVASYGFASNGEGFYQNIQAGPAFAFGRSGWFVQLALPLQVSFPVLSIGGAIQISVVFRK